MKPTESLAPSEQGAHTGFFRGMRGTLLAWFLLLAILPTVLVSTISYRRNRAELTRNAMQQLAADRGVKELIFNSMTARWVADIDFLTKLKSLKSDMVDMAAAFKYLGADRLKALYGGKPKLLDAGDGSSYSVVHAEEHQFFKAYIKIQGYDDILLIGKEGNLVYTLQKGDDFGADLLSEAFLDTNLARLYRDLTAAAKGEVRVVDVAVFQGEPAMFMGASIYEDDTILGYLVVKLPLGYLSHRMGIRNGLGETGETYVVGPDFRMRTDSFNDPAARNVKASLLGTTDKNGIDTHAVREALDGRSGIGLIQDYRGVEVLSAWAPLEFKGLHWAMMSEMDAAEALKPVNDLALIMAGLTLGAVGLAFVLSLLVAGFIVRPIRNLTDWSRRIAAGDLVLLDIQAPANEIGVLRDGMKEAVKSLLAAHKEQERRNWLKAGQADLDDRMRGVQDVDTLCSDVITFVAKRLGAQVGAIYTNDGKGLLRLRATYAYKTRKNLSNVFKLGEGLVGQAALEKQSILITRVPQNYIAVSSGLGEMPPTGILITPLVYNDAVLGVVEIGAFDAFSEDQRTFMEEGAQRIAIALHAAAAAQQVQKALKTTQRQAEELQSQQEELKAANEELEEQTEALKESEERLRNQQEELSATNEELEEKTQALERQKHEVEKANQELERARVEVEERARDLAMASKYKSEFLANMSHELRTPLNSLLLLARSLVDNREGTLTEEQIESARVIYDGGNQLLSLINEILDLSKIEAGKMDLHLEPVFLQDLADSLRERFQHMAKDKGLVFGVDIEQDAPTKIITDRKRVEQILGNLIGNAVKFTQAGKIGVRFGGPVPEAWLSRIGLSGAEILAISVQDTGIGIPEEKQKIIFEAFQQADGTTARRYGGTGLGLSISRELAHILRGGIHLESTRGEGSTFILCLPVEAAVQPTDKERQASLPRAQNQLAGRPARDSEPLRDRPSRSLSSPDSYRAAVPDDRETIQAGDRVILVIEDDPRFALLLVRQCRERGFKCLASATGEEGLSLAAAHLPQAVILDIRLPGINGWDVLEALKGNPDLRHIPVHIMSVDDPDMEALIKGAVGFLKKPAQQEELDLVFTRFEDVLSRKMKKVLVVEDDKVLRRSVINLIGGRDVQTDEAATAAETIQAMQANKYDCIILDLGLPDMTGFDLLKTMGATENAPIPPVIVYTGRDLTPDEEITLRQYAESIIIKGVKSDQRLLDEVSLFLHRVVGGMPEKQRKMIIDLHDADAMFQSKTVLMVDDDMRNVFALSRLLEERGLKVLKAADGRQALDILESRSDVDLVLMDIMMPVMDGYEAMHEIRSQSRFHNLPIIALTAKAMTGDRERCIQAGANDYLVKPVDLKRLLSMMRVWLYR